jgi:hypothetical protein
MSVTLSQALKRTLSPVKNDATRPTRKPELSSPATAPETPSCAKPPQSVVNQVQIAQYRYAVNAAYTKKQLQNSRLVREIDDEVQSFADALAEDPQGVCFRSNLYRICHLKTSPRKSVAVVVPVRGLDSEFAAQSEYVWDMFKQRHKGAHLDQRHSRHARVVSEELFQQMQAAYPEASAWVIDADEMDDITAFFEAFLVPKRPQPELESDSDD